MNPHREPEARLAHLLSVLPPAPEAWVEAAKVLPLISGTLDAIVSRAAADIAERERILADLEGALRQEGVEPRAAAVVELRRRLEA